MRGTKVQNLLSAPTGTYERLIGGLRAVPGRGARGLLRLAREGDHGRDRRPFARTGCPKLPSPDARRDCADGARTIDEALVTFS